MYYKHMGPSSQKGLHTLYHNKWTSQLLISGHRFSTSIIKGDNNVEHSFKNCVSFRFALTGLMSTTSCSKLSHQLEVICSHAPIISE